MIKFFRHIRHSLINENKMGKYFKYAIGEILLVVIGILIALNVNNWNEQRKSAKKEISILKVLKLEFEANREQLVSIMNLHKASTESGFSLIKYFNQDITKIPSVTFDTLVVAFNDPSTFDPRKGQLNSITSSGEINLISNQELNILLSSFEDMIKDTDEEEQAISTLVDDFADQGYSYINMPTIFKTVFNSPDNASFTTNYDMFFKDIRMYNIIGETNTWRYVLMLEEEDQLSSINRIISLIEKELNN